VSNADSSIARIIQISVRAQGGVPKLSIAETRLTKTGVLGDKQRNRQLHGGPDRAVCIYSWELIRDLQEEGHPIDCGTAGENLTVSGLDWEAIVPGVRLRAGQEAELEIVSYTTPCLHIKESFIDGVFSRISQKLHPGWSRVYARVLQEGAVRQGDSVAIQSVPNLFSNQP